MSPLFGRGWLIGCSLKETLSALSFFATILLFENDPFPLSQSCQLDPVGCRSWAVLVLGASDNDR